MDKKQPANSKRETGHATQDTLSHAKGDCNDSRSSSQTQFYKRKKYQEEYKRVTTDEYFSKSESISGSSDTFHCLHGPDGKLYTEEGRLKRNLIKIVDPIKLPREWNDKCTPAFGWQIAESLEFLVIDPAGQQQIDRIEKYLRDFSETSRFGYNVHVLKSVCVILDYLVENLRHNPNFREETIILLKITNKPILLTVESDVVSNFDSIERYIGFLGYLLIRLEEDELFEIVSKALIWQLSARNEARGPGSAQLRYVIRAAPALLHTVTRMLALSSRRRFPAFLQIAFLMTCDSIENCIEMVKENIIENIFYRFNPYFPHDDLPNYENNPADPEDYKVKLGDSSIHMQTTLSLLLVIVKTLKNYLDENPKCRATLPCPDYNSQRCFIWAYRFECRAREHRHERVTLTVIVRVLLHCFRDRLMAFSALLMPDVMSLSVLTEVPPTKQWIRTLTFSISQADVHFKKELIYLSVDFLKKIPSNSYMIESQYWLMGLLFLVDPGLSPLRASWSPALFSELRKTALQALVITVPIMSPTLIHDYGIVRRIMWYIEWYSEKPYELSILYWCLRLLQVALQARFTQTRRESLRELFNTHGIIILIHLCYTLLEQKCPPIEKSQVIMALCLRILTSATEANERLTCCVYPRLSWPGAGDALARKMTNTVIYSLEKHLIVSDRWIISLLNFIWEAIVWKDEFKELFILRNGVYNLLDITSMSKGPVQCMALAVLCDVARGGDAVAQLVTWRASLAASDIYPNIVKRGATIASLLAAVFRDECRSNGVQLDENGVIQNMDRPLQSSVHNPEYHEAGSQRFECMPAADSAGSRASKAFALLQLLSEDLAHKVSIADEAYKLYKNIQLEPEDEVTLVLCSHYLTLKLNETWEEMKIQSPGFLKQDEDVLYEFLEIQKGWAKEIKIQQQDILETHHKRQLRDEDSLYAFLGRVRLNVALDALREVRCAARSTRAPRLSAQRRTTLSEPTITRSESEMLPIRTFRSPLDDQNVTGQYVKVYSIQPK